LGKRKAENQVLKKGSWDLILQLGVPNLGRMEREKAENEEVLGSIKGKKPGLKES
jgi:hypothetical protein